MVRSLPIVCWGLMILFAGPRLTTATDKLRDGLPKQWSWSSEAQGPMCGVYAACRAVRILGASVEPVELWKTDFVGNMKGSTPGELVAAIRTLGYAASFRSGLNFSELSSLGTPVIANVRRYPEDKAFNHWVCVQATQEGLLVYDGASAGKVVNPAEFLATWSGLGIVVSHSSLSGLQLALVRLVGIGSLLFVIYLCLHWEKKADRSNRSTMRGVRGVVLATVASFVLGSLLFGVGSGHLEAVGVASAPYAHPHVKPGTLQDVLEASHSPGSLVVDARMESDYARGTIGNAVNIPVHASYPEIKTYLKDVPKTARIVVFCQSQACSYDEIVARKLSQAGYENVTVSDLGYREYLNNSKSKHDSPIAGR